MAGVRGSRSRNRFAFGSSMSTSISQPEVCPRMIPRLYGSSGLKPQLTSRSSNCSGVVAGSHVMWFHWAMFGRLTFSRIGMTW
jgi:hypothetical protein